MRRIITFVPMLSGLILLLCLFACDNSTGPEIQICPSPESIDFEEYSIPISLRPEVLDDNTLYVITTQEKFDEIFGEFDERKEIDFEKYRLYYVQGQVFSGIKKMYSEIYTWGYDFQVGIHFYYYDTTEAPYWNWASLVQDLESGDVLLYISNFVENGKAVYL